MSGIRELKKQETRRAIQDAALKLFTERSFEQTSIEDIAKEAGIGKTTIYGYFSTKDEIFIDFCNDELEQSFARLQALGDQGKPLVEQLVEFFMMKFTFVTKNEEFGRQLLREMVFPNQIKEKARLHDQRYFDILEDLLKKGQAKNEISKKHDIFFLSVHFFSLYLGALAGWYKGYLTSLQEAEQGLRILFNQVLGGIRE